MVSDIQWSGGSSRTRTHFFEPFFEKSSMTRIPSLAPAMWVIPPVQKVTHIHIFSECEWKISSIIEGKQKTILVLVLTQAYSF